MKVGPPQQRAGAVVLLLAMLLALMPHPVRPVTAQTITPAQVAAALGQLDGVASRMLTQTGVPGLAIAVVYRDEVVYLKGFGIREASRPETVDADTVFQLASVSKPIASTVVAALVGDGVVAWDDPIVKHDPGFQMYDPWVTSQVTLRDMFAHRSGLPDHAGDLLEDMGYGREEILYRLRLQKPDSSFRSAYAYTNFGLTEAGVAAARAAGRSWETVSTERLYRPLGMTSTSSRHADYLAAPNRARLHVLVDGTWVAKYDRDPDAQAPAGGVSSTVRDLGQWLRLQLSDGQLGGTRVIAADALRETRRPEIVNSPAADPSTQRSAFYGLGWNVNYDERGRVRLGHSGGFELGAATAVYLLPGESLGIAVLTNGAPIGLPEAVALSFLDLALDGAIQRNWLEIAGPAIAAATQPGYRATTDFTAPPARPVPALLPSAYAGVYGNDYFGPIEVVADPSGLVLRQGPNRTPFALTHYAGNVFFYQPTGENAGGLSTVTFEVGAGGVATSLLIENLNVNGQGTFVRVQSGK